MRRRSARPSRPERSLCKQLRPCERSLCRRGPAGVLYASRHAPAGVLYASLLLLAYKTPVGTETISEMCIENIGEGSWEKGSGRTRTDAHARTDHLVFCHAFCPESARFRGEGQDARSAPYPAGARRMPQWIPISPMILSTTLSAIVTLSSARSHIATWRWTHPFRVCANTPATFPHSSDLIGRFGCASA